MININEEDKKSIACNYAKQKEKIDSLRKSGRFVLGGSIFTSCLIAALVLLGGPIMLVYSLIEIVFIGYVVRTFKKANNITKDCIAGKISLKEFKTLLKDSEFQKSLAEELDNQQETSILVSYQYGTLADKHKPTKGSILGSYQYGTTANIENNEENNNSNNNKNNNDLTM